MTLHCDALNTIDCVLQVVRYLLTHKYSSLRHLNSNLEHAAQARHLKIQAPDPIPAFERMKNTHQGIEEPAEKKLLNNPPHNYYLTTNIHLQFITISTKRREIFPFSAAPNADTPSRCAALHQQCNARRRLHDGTCI